MTALACLSLAALGLAASAGGALDAKPKLRFSSLPARVVQGQPMAVTVAAPRGARCTLVVRYGDGNVQPGLNPPAPRTAARSGAGACRTPPGQDPRS